MEFLDFQYWGGAGVSMKKVKPQAIMDMLRHAGSSII